MEPTTANLRVATPLGAFELAANQWGLTRCQPAGSQGPPVPGAVAAVARAQLRLAETALHAYFAGEKDPWSALELRPDGSEFQQRVWQALRRIPFGQTLSYRELARSAGQPGAARAVGQANHRNPLAIIVPCHRVIAADGSLGGYAGGLELKRRLLEHEGALPASLPLRMPSSA